MSKLNWSILALLLFAFGPMHSFAGSVATANINRMTASCTEVTFDITAEAGDSVVLRVVEVATGSILGLLNIPYGGTNSNFTRSISLSPDVESGTQLRLEMETRSAALVIASDTASVTASCDAAGNALLSTCDDGRININLCEPIAIYPIFDGEETHMVIYNVEVGDDIGEFALFLSADTLDNLPEDIEEPLELGRSEDNFIVVYWLGSEYQIVAGPDFEGKYFIYRFSSFPGLPSIETFKFNGFAK